MVSIIVLIGQRLISILRGDRISGARVMVWGWKIPLLMRWLDVIWIPVSTVLWLSRSCIPPFISIGILIIGGHGISPILIRVLMLPSVVLISITTVSFRSIVSPSNGRILHIIVFARVPPLGSTLYTGPPFSCVFIIVMNDSIITLPKINIIAFKIIGVPVVFFNLFSLCVPIALLQFFLYMSIKLLELVGLFNRFQSSLQCTNILIKFVHFQSFPF